MTIGGTVSPAGGNFEEPVTQGTLKVVGAFHGLSRERSDARKFPSVDPLESWSKYNSFIDNEKIQIAKELLVKGDEISQMMKVVGEEGTTVEDYVLFLKGDFFDNVYLQQNGFDEVDATTKKDRQDYVFSKVVDVLGKEFTFEDKDEARKYFYELRHTFIDWNYKKWDSNEFDEQEKSISFSGKGQRDRGVTINGEESDEEGKHENNKYFGKCYQRPGGRGCL